LDNINIGKLRLVFGRDRLPAITRQQIALERISRLVSIESSTAQTAQLWWNDVLVSLLIVQLLMKLKRLAKFDAIINLMMSNNDRAPCISSIPNISA
jgi:hypothetical protein